MTRLTRLPCPQPGCTGLHGTRTVRTPRTGSLSESGAVLGGDAQGHRDATPSGAPVVSEAPSGLARGPVRSIPPERLSTA